jgi:hypothetical protein
MGRLTTTTTTKTTTELKLNPKLERQIKTELHGYAAVHQEIKALSESKKEHSVNLLDMVTANLDPEHQNFELDGFKVATITNAKDKRLDKDKLKKLLVAEGISLKKVETIIAKATVEKPKKSHVRITIPGEVDDAE